MFDYRRLAMEHVKFYINSVDLQVNYQMYLSYPFVLLYFVDVA